jgi:hypothetical protein
MLATAQPVSLMDVYNRSASDAPPIDAQLMM